jgi:hypothetical protein
MALRKAIHYLKCSKTSFIKCAANVTVLLFSSNEGFTSEISKERIFSFDTICLIMARTNFGFSPNGDGALTPGA